MLAAAVAARRSRQPLSVRQVVAALRSAASEVTVAAAAPHRSVLARSSFVAAVGMLFLGGTQQMQQ